MSPPTKAADIPTLDRDVETPTATPGGTSQVGDSAMSPRHAAVVGGQQAAGNRAMAALLGGGHGVQRAPNDEARDPRISGMAHAPTLDPRPAPAPAIASPTALAPTQPPAPPLRVNTDTPISGMGNPAPAVKVNTDTPISGMGNPAGPARGGGPPPAPAGGAGPGPARGAPGDPDFVRGGPLPRGGAAVPAGEQWWQSDPRFAVGAEFGPKPVGPGQVGGRAKPASVDPVPTPVNAAIVGAAYGRDASRVIRSPDMDFHQQAWGFSRGPKTFGDAPPPQAFTDGRYYFVAPDYPGEATPLPGYAATGDVGLGKPGTPGTAAAGTPAAPTPVASAPATGSPDRMRQAVAPYTPYTGEPRGSEKPRPVTRTEVMDALQSGSATVVRSPHARHHRQGYRVDGGGREAPGAYKVGNLYVIDHDYPVPGVPKLGTQTPAASSGGAPAPGAAPARRGGAQQPRVENPIPKAMSTVAVAPINPELEGDIPRGEAAREGDDDTEMETETKKPAKYGYKDYGGTRQSVQERKKVTKEATETTTDTTTYNAGLKGVGRETRNRQEVKKGDRVVGRESFRKIGANLDGLNLSGGTSTDEGAAPSSEPGAPAPKKTRTSVQGNMTAGPGGVGGGGTAAIESNTGAKAEVNASAKIGPDGVEGSLGGSVTSAGGFTGKLSVSGKYNVIAKDPKRLPNGTFSVDFVVTDEKGVALGAGYNKPGGGASASIDVSSSTSTEQFETKVFDSEVDAKLFQATAAMTVSKQTDSIKKATTAAGAKEMKEGEQRGTSTTDTDTVGGSLSIEGAEFGVAMSEATKRGLVVKKMAGSKVQVTPSVTEQKAINASISAFGAFGITKGSSEANSFAITYEFDLGDAAAAALFERYCKTPFPPPMPPLAKWINTTTGHAIEDHDVYSFAKIGKIGWGDHSSQETVEDESGRHTTTIGGQSETVDLNWVRHITRDKNRHATADIVSRMDNDKITSITALMTVGGEDADFNRAQFRKIFDDKGPKAGTTVKTSGEWTLSADIDKKKFEEMARDNEDMRKAKTREEKLKIYSELAQAGGAAMLSGQVRGRKMAWNLELKGDPNFPGAAGRQALNDQRKKLATQLHAKPQTAGSVAADAKDTLDALKKRLDAVSDESNYTDLPTALRDEQKDLINTHIAEFKALRSEAISVQMGTGKKENLTVVLNRAVAKDGYRDVPEQDRGWRKAQDLVNVHQVEITTLTSNIVQTRAFVETMYNAPKRLKFGGDRINRSVYADINRNVNQKADRFFAMEPLLKTALEKTRDLKDKWDTEPDPKVREDQLRAYDKVLLDVIHIKDSQLTVLQDMVREAYLVMSDSFVEDAANDKFLSALKVDNAGRSAVMAGMDEAGNEVD